MYGGDGGDGNGGGDDGDGDVPPVLDERMCHS